jgi:hypothetical protein
LNFPLFVLIYTFNKHLNDDLTLIDFLRIHYKKTIDVDGDFDKDMQLPFKTTQIEFSGVINVVVPSSIHSIQTLPFFKNQHYIVCDEAIPHSLNNNSVFQPPRFV